MIRGAMKIEVRRGAVFWRWILKSSNGQTLGVSETYYSKSGAKRAAEKISKAINVPYMVF